MPGVAVRNRRTELGISQRQCALNAGISPSLMSLIEAEKRYPSTKTLEGLSLCLRGRFVIEKGQTRFEPEEDET